MNKRDNNRLSRRKKRRTQWEKLRESPISGISTLPDGGLVSAPMMGKALGGRLGRRIGGGDTGPQDMNPMTARDSDLDGMVLEGIPTIRQGRGIPDPTPGGEIAGRMAREHNKDEFVGLPQLLRQHFAQFAKFQEWTRNKDWRAFHRNHFDWWMFPIPRGSNSYRDEYNIAGEPLEDLLRNNRYMTTLPAAMRMYMQSIGWNLDEQAWIEDADINNGQEPIRSLNSARLYKIAQSAEAHGFNRELQSVSKMVDDLRRNGVHVGNDQYWDGISGKMANDPPVDFNDPDFPKNLGRKDYGYEYKHKNGRTYIFTGNPLAINNGWMVASDFVDYRAIPDGKKDGERIEVTAADGKTKYRLVWKGMSWKKDKQAPQKKRAGGTGKGGLSSERRLGRAQSIALKPGTKEFTDFFSKLDMLWNWRDESARIEAVKTHKANNVKPDKPLYNTPQLALNTDNDLFPQLWDVLKPLGIWIEKKRGGHEKLGDSDSGWFDLASTPGDRNSALNAVGNLLQHLNEDVNPELFYTHFEHWMRNPYSTMINEDGDEVGVRLALNDDRDALLVEYRKRVAALYKAAYAMNGETPPERVANIIRESQANDWVELGRRNKFATSVIVNETKQIVADGPPPRSLDRLAYLLAMRLQTRLDADTVNKITTSDSLVESMLRDAFKTRDWGRDDAFFAPDVMPGGDDESLDYLRQLAEQYLYKVQEDTNIFPREITDSHEAEFYDSVADESINRPVLKQYLQNVADGISGSMKNTDISGRMSSLPENDTEARDLGYNPDIPDHLGNHFTSRPSSYDKRPNPVDTPDEARTTGAPLKGLVPGDYHPDVAEHLNNLIDKVVENGFHNQFQTMPTHYMGATSPEEIAAQEAASDFRAFLGSWSAQMQSILMRLYDWAGTDFDLTEDHKMLLRGYLSDEELKKLTKFSQIPTTYTDRYGTHDMSVVRNLIGGQLPSGLRVSTGSEIQEVADGLAQRAVHSGLKINNLRRMGVSDMDRATDETLDWWNDSLGAALVVNNPDEEVGGAWSSLSKDVNISIGMTLDGLLSMFNDGEYKTLFETGKSSGNTNTGARQIAEFAMFGILPSYRGKRPAYGIVNYGPVTRDGLDNTHQYGPFVIVLKKDVNGSATWTESDSLSLMSSASSLDAPSQHSLFQQRQILDVPFLRTRLSLDGRSSRQSADDAEAIGQFQFAEAQLHRPITVDDISHIIVDSDAWYRPDQYIHFPPISPDGRVLQDGSQEYDDFDYPQDIMDYDGTIQISRIAASLNIPLIFTEDLDNSDGEEKYGPEYL